MMKLRPESLRQRLLSATVALLAFGLGSSASAQSSSRSLPNPRAIPISESYRTLLETLSYPTGSTYEEAGEAMGDLSTMLRVETARRRVGALKTVPTELVDFHAAAMTNLQACAAAVQTRRQLDSRTPDIEGLVSTALDAGPAVVTAARAGDLRALSAEQKGDVAGFVWTLGKEAYAAYETSQAIKAAQARYQSNYTSLRRASAGNLWKPAGTFPTVADLLDVDMDGTVGGFFTRGNVNLGNSTGQTLTDCAVFLNAYGNHRGYDDMVSHQHVFFVRRWAPGERLIAKFGSSSFEGVNSDVLVDDLSHADIYVSCDEGAFCQQYIYRGEEYAKDLRRWAEGNKLSFGGKWYRYGNHTFFDDGFEVSNDGERPHPISAAVLVVHYNSGGQAKTQRIKRIFKSGWWPGTSNKVYISHELLNGLRPTKVDVELQYPHSDYVRTITWDSSFFD